MKLFFLYDTSDADAAGAARKFAAQARAAGHESFDPSFPDFQARLLDARILFVFFNKADDVYSWAIEEHWRLYYDEITWYKRKAEGEIICALGGGMEREALPFTLQNCKILRYGDLSALTETLKAFSPQKPPAVPAPQQAKQFNSAPAKPAVPAQKPAVPAYQRPEAAKRRDIIKTVKRAADWIWLIALIPMSAGVMYGIAAAVNYLNVSSFILLLPIVCAFAFLLPPAVNLPFYASRIAGKCAKYFKWAAIAACIVIDIVFMNFHAPAAYIPEINMRLRGVSRLIACAAIPCVFFAVERLMKNIRSLKFGLFFRFSPLAAYLACHATDYYVMNTGFSVVPLILLLFVFTAIGSVLRFVLRTAVKNRVVLKCWDALGYAAFIALFIAALMLGNPFFSI